MKKLLLTLLLVMASLPVFAYSTTDDIAIDKMNLLDTSIYEVASKSKIEVQKTYNDSGDLDTLVKSVIVVNMTNPKPQEDLKTCQFGGMQVFTYNNSDKINKVTLMIMDFEELDKYSFTHVAKLFFGSANVNKVQSKGSKEWPDDLIYIYDGVYNGKNVQMTYYEPADYHLGEEYGSTLFALEFTD